MSKIGEPIKMDGNIKIKKEGEGKKFLKLFFTGSFTEAVKYAFVSVFVPYAKDIICKTSTNAISFWVNGDKPAQQNVGPNRISYSSNYKPNNVSYYQNTSQPIPAKTVGVTELSNIVLPTRAWAEVILEKIKDSLNYYHVITVQEVYDYIIETLQVNNVQCNFKIPYTANDYGWRDLTDAKIIPNGTGWSLYLPKVTPLK